MQSSGKLLYNLAFSKNISHASIFECSDSHTSLKIAKDIVKILICNNKQNRPCNVCSNCIKINKDSHADVKFDSKSFIATPSQSVKFGANGNEEIVEDINKLKSYVTNLQKGRLLQT